MTYTYTGGSTCFDNLFTVGKAYAVEENVGELSDNVVIDDKGNEIYLRQHNADIYGTLA